MQIQSSAEQGMLDLLSFKRSMFAGVLDDGQNSVHLKQSQMSRFMETVEKATNSIPESMPTQASLPSPEAKSEGATEGAVQTSEPWSEVISTGVSLIERLGTALKAERNSKKQPPFIVRDSGGKPCLQIPLPDDKNLRKMMTVFAQFAQNLQGLSEELTGQTNEGSDR